MDVLSEKIEQIRTAVENELYLPALALALTLPDICCKIKYKNGKGEDYARWFDEYIGKLNYPAQPNFNGNDCYGLRCEFLHNGRGNSILNGKERYTEFHLNLENNGCSVNTIDDDFSQFDEDTQKMLKMRTITLSVPMLCRDLCNAACIFYHEIKDKSIFQDDNIVYEKSSSVSIAYIPIKRN